MKFKFIIRLCALIGFVLLFSDCGLFKNSNTSNVEARQVSTGSSDCDFGIELFNEQAAGRIMNDIKAIHQRLGNIPEDLRELYPAAKVAWNRALNQVKYEYKNDYIVTSIIGLTSQEMKDWRNKNLEDYQKFFLLLTEYQHGHYPENTNDTSSLAAWVENADPKKRLEAYVKAAITSNCRPIDRDRIRQALNPVLLPESIEECYD